MHKRLRIMLCLAAALLFTGCWDKMELEDRGFVISIGIDKAGGESAFDLTMTLPNVAAIAGKDGAEGENARTLLHAQADALSAAMHKADAQTGRSLHYGHTKIAVFGADFLSDAELFKQAINALDRSSEVSQKLILLATEDTAADILAAKSPNEPLIGTFVSNFYKNNADNLHITVAMNLEQLLLNLNTTGHAILPRITVEDGDIRLSGAAILKNAALTGWLNETQTRGLLWLRGEGEGTLLTVPYDDPATARNRNVPFRTTHCTRTLAFRDTEDGLVCRLTLHAMGSIEEMTVTPDMLIPNDTLQTLSRQFEREITTELQQAFTLFQTEYGIDADHLLRELYKQNPNLYRQYADNLDAAFRQMTLETDIRVTITR